MFQTGRRATIFFFKYLRKLLSNGEGGGITPGAPGLNPLLDTSLFYLLVYFSSIADIDYI
jgi:hypothetical protein